MEYNLLTMESCKEKKRSTTDIEFLIIFGILTLVWINIGIYGFSAGNIPSEIISDIKSWINDNRIMEALSYNKLLLIEFIAFAVVLVALFLLMVGWITKCMIYATFVGLGLQLVYLSSFYLMWMNITFASANQLLLAYTIFGIKIYALNKVGMTIVCKVVQDAIKALNSFPSSVFIVLLEFIIELSVIIFTVTVGAYLLFIEKTSINQAKVEYDYDNGYSNRLYSDEDDSNVTKYSSLKTIANADPPVYVVFLLSIFVIIAFWIVCFIGNFRRMLLHGMFTHWYRASNKKNISNTVGLRHFTTVVRYHVGTIAFSSTIFVIVPIIRALFNSGKGLLRLIKNRPSSLYALWYALWESTTNASIRCISNGTSLYQSTKDGLQLVMRNPLKYILMRGVTFGLIELGVYIVLFINLNIEVQLYDLLQMDYQDPDLYSWFKQTSTIVIGIFTLVMSAIYMVIFNNAAEAVIICFFEESNSSKTTAKDGDYLVENDET